MKKLRKLLCVLLIFTMAFSMVACNNDEEQTEQPNGQVEDDNSAQNDQDQEDNTEVEGPASQPENPTEYPFTFTDSTETEITLEKAPIKIASGAPSITEIIYALNQQDLLLGVTEYCNFPEDAASKEKIGGFSEPNVKKLIELEVDLFITEYVDDATKSTLNDAGITVAMISSYDYNTVFKNIELVAEILDAKNEGANQLEYMTSKTDYIISLVEDEESIKVFNEIWHDPIMAAGPGSFMHEMIEMLGGENVAGDAESAYPEYSVELIIQKNPEVYITADDGFKTVEDIKARPGFDEIDAVVNERIYFFNQDIISRPGPRIVDALELVARAMYPSVYNEGK